MRKVVKFSIFLIIHCYLRLFGCKGPLELIEIKDVSLNITELLRENPNFLKDLKMRHNHKELYWHVLSGSAIYFPKLKSTILFERIFYSIFPTKGHRVDPQKSFITYSMWSDNWKNTISPAGILNVNETIGKMYTDDIGYSSRKFEGPEDPRCIYDEVKDEINLNFNVLTLIEGRQMFRQTLKFSKSNESRIDYKKIGPMLQLEHDKGYRAEAEKNWTPILIKGELHYVYSLRPLRILKCEDIKETNEEGDITTNRRVCRVQFDGETLGSKPQTGQLRGGTNWIEYSPGVYFSMARINFKPNSCPRSFYRPYLVVLKFVINPKTGYYTEPHVISVSDPILDFDKKIFELYAKKGLASRRKCDDEAVLTPGSISNWTGIENSDIADVIISVNDDMNLMLRIKGFGAAVEEAIKSAPTSIEETRAISKSGILITQAENKIRNLI